MGKRSDFERIPRDFYPTPPAAVGPLIPHIPASCTFIEPCAGDGALIDALPFQCVWAGDIKPRRDDIRERDALGFTTLPQRADLIITNPPWDRLYLHPMIERFSAMRPTWLLFDADWMHTKQSVPFMSRLVKVVSIGRVKWFPESKMTGKDNCAWYLFDANHSGPTEFVGRTA